MVESGSASLVIHSEIRTAREISSVLGAIPARSHERGSRVSTTSDRTRSHAAWVFDVPALRDSVDQTGFNSVRELLRLMEPMRTGLESLSTDCDIAISWWGDSDSSQGGFVMPADLIRDLASFGLPLRGTVYLDDPTVED